MRRLVCIQLRMCHYKKKHSETDFRSNTTIEREQAQLCLMLRVMVQICKHGAPVFSRIARKAINVHGFLVEQLLFRLRQYEFSCCSQTALGKQVEQFVKSARQCTSTNCLLCCQVFTTIINTCFNIIKYPGILFNDNACGIV